MRSSATTVALLIATCAVSGCATGFQGLGVLASIRHGGSEQLTFSEFAAREATYSPAPETTAFDAAPESSSPPTPTPDEPLDGFVAVSDSGVSWADSQDDQAPPVPEVSQDEAPTDETSLEPTAEPVFPTAQAPDIGIGPSLPSAAEAAPPAPSVDAATGYPVALGQNEMPNRGEEIATPQPDGADAFKPHTDEADTDRFTRRLIDVPIDIRPTEGIMPGNPGATKFAETAVADPRQFHQVPGIGVSCTPWTICFRPLYFEEVMLERYGDKTPCCLQPAVSGVRFFSNVALLPYKMRVRPPRSFVCSNGFSRVGDRPLPGYGECVWRWDAAAVEIAAVTGFVFILP